MPLTPNLVERAWQTGSPWGIANQSPWDSCWGYCWIWASRGWSRHGAWRSIVLHYNYGLWNNENSAVQIARAFNYNAVCTLACCCFKYVHNRFCASSTTTIVRCAMLHSTCIYCRMSDSLRSEETNITYKCVVTEYESWSSLKQSFLLYLIIIIIGMMVDYGVSEDDITRPLLHCHTRLFDTGNDIDKMPSSFGYKL